MTKLNNMKTLVNVTPVHSVVEFPNEVIKTIYTRRSVRKFKNKLVSEDLIEQLLNAGMMAPSAVNKQPWKFYVLTNREDIRKISKQVAKEAMKGVLSMGLMEIIDAGRFMLQSSHALELLNSDDHIFYDAPVVILITSPKNDEWGELDIGMCSQNIMLAAKSIGIDSCPIGLAKFIEHTEIYSKLNIPATDQVKLAIILGYGDESPEPKMRVKGNIFYIH